MTLYWVLAPLLLALVGLAIELRNQRERKRYPFPERARAIHEALRRGADVTIEFWSRSQNRYLRRALKPLEMQGFYLRAIDKESGEEVAFKITRIKKITLDRAASAAAEAVEKGLAEAQLAPLPWERQRRRDRKRPLARALILIGATGTFAVLAGLWLKNHRGGARLEFDQTLGAFRRQEEVPVKQLLAEYAPTKPSRPAVVPAPPAAGIEWNVMLATEDLQPRADVRQSLHQVFGYPSGIAEKLADDLARRGKVVVWSGAFGPATNFMARLKLNTVVVTVEPREADAGAGVPNQ